MQKEQKKKKTDLKPKVKRLRLNKETVKDLEPEESPQVKAGAQGVTNPSCIWCDTLRQCP